MISYTILIVSIKGVINMDRLSKALELSRNIETTKPVKQPYKPCKARQGSAIYYMYKYVKSKQYHTCSLCNRKTIYKDIQIDHLK